MVPIMKNLILDATTKSITAVMSGAAATTDPDFTAHYADITASAYTPGSNDGTLNGAAAVTIVAAPAASTYRIINAITIQNRDTAAVTVTLRYVSAGGTRQIWSGTLAVGDTLTLDGTYDNTGSLRTAMQSGLITTQHTHAKLVASDGTPDPSFSADAAGALTAVGALTIGGLLDISAAAAGQLKFPTSQNASADANTLDDYEEGTWTATLTCGTSGTITLSGNAGTYTKIGRAVTVTALLTVDSVSSPVGSLTLGGLPFAAVTGAEFRSAPGIYANTMEVTAQCMVGILNNAATTMLIRNLYDGNAGNAAGVIKAGTTLGIGLMYFTT